ncbi:GFA family protein [Variovorax davisae]|uniref:GFA family protein n=1 Tax=Variovorax davisae TaxID=3053515 RepID=UPI004037F012
MDRHGVPQSEDRRGGEDRCLTTKPFATNTANRSTHMESQANGHQSATCRCGAVQMDMTGAPILAGSCYCRSCQAAGRHFEVSAGT